MSGKPFDRFRRLERPRAGAPDDAPAPTATDGRIGAVEGPAAPAPAGGEPPASGGNLGRFRAPPERSLELDLAGDGAQPFLRCMSCETDNFRTAPRCTTCGADLDTEPVRLFNQRFWAARQAEAAAEAAAGAERRAVLEAEAVREAATRRATAEAMAREVGDFERERLGREGLGSGWAGGGLPDWLGGVRRPTTPPVFRLLRALPPGWAVPVGLVLLAVPAVLYLVRPVAGAVAGAVLLVLCLPGRRRTWLDSWFGR